MRPSHPVPLRQGTGGEGPWVPHRGRVGGALRLGGLAGLLLALAFPPLPLPLLAFLALAPLALLLERVPPGSPGSRAVLVGGGACGAVSWGLLLYWVPGALLPVAPLLAFPLYILVVGVLAAWTAAVARGALALRRRGIPLVLALPILWTSGEWLRSTSPGVGLAWLPLGTALAPLPPLAAPAEWVGVYGLSLWAGAVGTAAGVLLARGTARGLSAGGLSDGGLSAPGPGAALSSSRTFVASWGRWGLPLFLFLLPAAVGMIRDRTLVTFPFVEVAALQFASPGVPGVPPETGEVSRVLAPLLAEAPTSVQGVDLLLLPEGTIPSGVRVVPGPAGQASGDDAGAAALLSDLAQAAARGGVPLLAGGYAASEDAGVAANAALLFDPAGAIEAVHLKRHLVPGIEAGFPGVGRLMAFLGWTPRRGGWLGPGRAPGTFLLEGRRLGVLICYESAFPAAARIPATLGAEAFVSLTHEGWFGDGLLGAIPREQHIAHLRLRAVESRSGILRSAADGEAVLVDPRGRVTHRGGEEGDLWLTGTLEGVAGRSFHTRVGQHTGGVLLLLVLSLTGSAVAGGGGLRGRR